MFKLTNELGKSNVNPSRLRSIQAIGKIELTGSLSSQPITNYALDKEPRAIAGEILVHQKLQGCGYIIIIATELNSRKLVDIERVDR